MPNANTQNPGSNPGWFRPGQAVPYNEIMPLVSLNHDLQCALGQFLAKSEVAGIGDVPSKSEALVLNQKKNTPSELEMTICPKCRSLCIWESSSHVKVRWINRSRPHPKLGGHCSSLQWHQKKGKAFDLSIYIPLGGYESSLVWEHLEIFQKELESVLAFKPVIFKTRPWVSGRKWMDGWIIVKFTSQSYLFSVLNFASANRCSTFGAAWGTACSYIKFLPEYVRFL